MKFKLILLLPVLMAAKLNCDVQKVDAPGSEAAHVGAKTFVKQKVQELWQRLQTMSPEQIKVKWHELKDKLSDTHQLGHSFKSKRLDIARAQLKPSETANPVVE